MGVEKGDAVVVLKFNGAWRFTPPENGRFLNKSIPAGAVDEFLTMILKIATQGSRQGVLEHFKSHFCAAIGTTHVRSSNESWAESDLSSFMHNAADNPPLFIEAFFDACESLRNRTSEWFLPDHSMINEILGKHNVGYEIKLPDLLIREQVAPVVSVSERSATLAEQAIEMFQKSLERSEELLLQNRPREAVQEILWLLETASTAFRGIETEAGTIQGKYFNQIVRDLRAKNAGTTLDRVLEWVANAHGFLSSPSGGGVRHGLDLNSGVELSLNEARLFTNLIRSYLSFLLVEHERLSNRGI
ncbi:hypothetical protein [Nitrosomonas sp.]|uniref:hypothetical protein n=1 Tax=Nitrosomonas sp. TaxID=42353 RepID=UPI0025F1283F|nr:hypothetical protein [Nitrosomonas sp.]